MPAKLFYSYSHDDEDLRNQLDKHLAGLRRQGLIEQWHDRRIVVGEDIDETISEHLESADVVLLLVSASFLASNYCYSREMARAMERRQAGEAAVVPVILRDCDWQHPPLNRLMAAPRDGVAITSWPNRDEAYANVARQIRTLVENMGKRPTAPAMAPPQTMAAAAPVPAPSASAPRHSANVLLKKKFTDLDKHTFLDEAFESIAAFFKASLDALARENPGAVGQFKRVDAQTFVASVYLEGRQVSTCSVHAGGGALRDTAITYSTDPSARGNSFNERLSVETNDRGMFLRSMGMATMGTGRNEAMTMEQGAELLWSLLVQRLR
jgi:hypothetical protein